MANRRLSRLDLAAEALFFRASANGKPISNAEAVQVLSARFNVGYRTCWTKVRNARRRFRRKYQTLCFISSTFSIPPELLANWIENRILTPYNYKAVIRILHDYSRLMK